MSRAALVAILAGWLVVALIAVLRDWQAIQTVSLADPDDALRLVQVRALLDGQGWFDLHQYRIAPPAGVMMHWSRLVDAPLAAVILLLRPLLGQAGAEQAAVVAVPLLTLLAAQLFLGRIAWKRLGLDAVMICSILMLLMLPAMMQFKPLRIDHHGWQIVAVVAALGALLTSDPRKGGLIAGSALAFGLSISLELLPFAALFAVVFGLRWLADPTQRLWLVRYLDCLTLLSCAFFLATRGLGDLTQYCDAVSPAYLAGFAATTLAVRGLAAAPALRVSLLLPGLALAGMIGAGAFLYLAPDCTNGPFARLDPLVKDFWYDNVKEGMPVWRQDLAVMVQMLVPPLAGLQAAVRLALKDQTRDGARFWGEYAGLLGGAIVVSIAVSRFSSVSAAIAVVPLTWQLREWSGLLARLRGWPARLALIVAAGLVLLPGLAIQGAQKLQAKPQSASLASAATAPDAPPPIASKACSMPASLIALGRLVPGTVLAPLDVGPHLLVSTGHRVVATGHHRASAAMHDVIAAFLGNAASAHAIVQRRGVDYVVLCTDLTEAQMYRERAPGGLAGSLLGGRSPDWLRPVALGPGAEQMRVWQVVR